jgi:hypothetical protein
MNTEMLVMWVVVGLVAGWLAGFVMKGGGYGLMATSSSVSPAASWGAGSSRPWGFLRERGCSRRSSGRSS